MYLVLTPIHRLDGQHSSRYEASYVSDAIQVSNYFNHKDVHVYKLDSLTRLEKITFITQEFEAA